MSVFETFMSKVQETLSSFCIFKSNREAREDKYKKVYKTKEEERKKERKKERKREKRNK